MIVISFFDGMACGLEALKRAGIKVDKYYAFEIDKYAIKIAKKNHPEIIHLGDIQDWKNQPVDVPDLIIGGSPCQGFSVAGKQLNFDDPRSALFFVFVDIVNHYKKINPDLKYLLENVKMKREWIDTISSSMGLEPVKINSSLVSAQNRERMYWANWEIRQPQDKGIILADILENGFVDRQKSLCLDANYYRGGNKKRYYQRHSRQLVFLKTKPHGYVKESVKTSEKYPSLVAQDPSTKHCILVGMATDVRGYKIRKRIYSPKEKSPTLTAASGGGNEPKIEINDAEYRKLSVLECERLQTLPECDIIQSLWLHITKLSNQNKTCVPVEISSGRLIKPAGTAGNDKLNTFVKLVTENFIIKHPLSEFTAQIDADTAIEIQTLKPTNRSLEDLMWYVGNAENLLQFQNQESEARKKELSALLSASINSIQVKIVVSGLEVLHLRDKSLYPLQNGERLLDRSGREIKNPVDGVVYINQNLNTPIMFTTLSPLLVAQRIEQIQTILSFYAQNAIDGYTLKQMLIDGCWTCPITNKPIEIHGYTSGVSNTQRYKMIGNGWTIDVISHIFCEMEKQQN